MYSRRAISDLITGVTLACLVLMSLACAADPKGESATFLQSGLEYYEKADYKRAVLQLRNAAQLSQGDPEPYYQLARTYLKLQNVREAVVALKKATELDPQHREAQLLLADLMLASRDPDVLRNAEQLVETVLSSESADPEARFLLAAAKIRLGDDGDAEELFEEVLRTSPDHLKSSIALALLKLKAQDSAAAESILRAAAEWPTNW